MRMLRMRLLTLTLVMGIALILGGCAAPNGDLAKFLKPYESNTSTTEYRLQPPDQITIQCARIAEVNGKSQKIRPDGMISFEGLGEIEAAGKTPKELAEDIKAKAESLYSIKGDYPIDVQISTYSSSLFYVMGEVALPGAKTYTGRETVLTAIADAKLQVTSWASKIRLVRPSPDGSEEANIIEINLKKMMKKGVMDRNVLLEEGDILYVPPTPLSAIAMVIEEFVRPIGRALSPVYQYYQVQAYAGR